MSLPNSGLPDRPKAHVIGEVLCCCVGLVMDAQKRKEKREREKKNNNIYIKQKRLVWFYILIVISKSLFLSHAFNLYVFFFLWNYIMSTLAMEFVLNYLLNITLI